MTDNQKIAKYHRGHEVKYCPQHDAMYCETCDEWISQHCRDIECRFCRNRPERPSMVDMSNQTEPVGVSVQFSDNEFAHPCHVNRAISLVRSGRAIPTGIKLRKKLHYGG